MQTLPNPLTLGKVDFGTGTGGKAFYDFFFGLILDPLGTYASTAKKGNSLVPAFFSPLHGLLEKWEGLVLVYVFFSLTKTWEK